MKIKLSMKHRLPNLTDYQMNKIILNKRGFMKIEKVTKYTILLSCIVFVVMLSGCAAHQLKAPCPSYGKWCEKIPVNSWNDNN